MAEVVQEAQNGKPFVSRLPSRRPLSTSYRSSPRSKDKGRTIATTQPTELNPTVLQAPCDTRERYSQLGQDLWVLKHHPQPGRFLDIGAHDGISYSNTYLLEQMGWQGLCVEADNRSYARLKDSRAWTLNKAAWRTTGAVLPFNQHNDEMLSGLGSGDTTVETVSINDLCDMVGHVDYVSLDTEGSEVEILKAYDWSHNVKLWTVEHNNDNARISWLVSQFMSNGYLVRMFHWEMVAVRDVG